MIYKILSWAFSMQLIGTLVIIEPVWFVPNPIHP